MLILFRPSSVAAFARHRLKKSTSGATTPCYVHSERSRCRQGSSTPPVPLTDALTSLSSCWVSVSFNLERLLFDSLQTEGSSMALGKSKTLVHPLLFLTAIVHSNYSPIEHHCQIKQTNMTFYNPDLNPACPLGLVTRYLCYYVAVTQIQVKLPFKINFL